LRPPGPTGPSRQLMRKDYIIQIHFEEYFYLYYFYPGICIPHIFGRQEIYLYAVSATNLLLVRRAKLSH
jgi:hypothetical protein